MESTAISVENQVEISHWWFVGRRLLLRRILRKLNNESRVLDVGSGTGSNLRVLVECGFRQIIGIDRSPDAVAACAGKGLPQVVLGDANNIPFPHDTFDVVLATDILEHLDDDAAGLKEMARVLKPHGMLLMMVPAFPILWGLQDKISHHRRRYQRPDLQRKLHEAGIESRRSFYFNFILFLPILLMRQLMRVFPLDVKSENEINSPILNFVLRLIFSTDVFLAPLGLFPFGVSIFVAGKKS